MTRRMAIVRSALIGVLVGVTTLAAAQLPATNPEVAASVVMTDRYPATEVTFPNGVKDIAGAVYWEPVGFRPLALDMYLPPSTLSRPSVGFPLVIYIHGGAWIGGDARRSGTFVDFPGVLAALSARGYVVASIDYRRSGEARFPAQAQDVKAAIRWLRLNAVTYGIDVSRVLTWGASAGGHLAALAAVSCNAAALEPQRSLKALAPDTKADAIVSAEVSDCVQGAVAWYGVFDMTTIADQARKANAAPRDVADAPEWQLLGCFGTKKCKPRQLAAASPVTYIDANTPPILLIAGTDDTTVPHAQTLEMADKLKAAGVHSELVVLPGINHSFVGKTPEATRDASVKALAATFVFIDQTIGNTPETRR